jgi:hypothetical protein
MHKRLKLNTCILEVQRLSCKFAGAGEAPLQKGPNFKPRGPWLTRRVQLGVDAQTIESPARRTKLRIETARSLGSAIGAQCEAGDGRLGADAAMRSPANCSYEAIEAALLCARLNCRKRGHRPPARKLVWTKRSALPSSGVRSVGARADIRGDSRTQAGGGNRRLYPESGCFVESYALVGGVSRVIRVGPRAYRAVLRPHWTIS